MTLFEGELAPITFRIAFIRALLKDVLQQYVRWQHSLLKVVSREPTQGSLYQKLQRILPLDDVGERVLFTETDSDWVAVFDNRVRGTNVGTVIAVLSERLDAAPALVLVNVPDTFSKSKRGGRRGLWGRLALTAYGRQPATRIWGITRSVSISNDVSGWKFEQIGSPWDFEDLERYNGKTVQMRLDSQLITEYLSKFGIYPQEERFYAGAGFATRSRFPLNPRPKTFDPADLTDS